MKIEYLAKIRDAMGCPSETVDLPHGVTTASDLLVWLAARNDRSASAFLDRANIHVALDDRIANRGDELAGVQTVTLFPPVTGG